MKTPKEKNVEGKNVEKKGRKINVERKKNRKEKRRPCNMSKLLRCHYWLILIFFPIIFLVFSFIISLISWRMERARTNIWSFIRCIVSKESLFQHLYVQISTVLNVDQCQVLLMLFKTYRYSYGTLQQQRHRRWALWIHLSISFMRIRGTPSASPSHPHFSIPLILIGGGGR